MEPTTVEVTVDESRVLYESGVELLQAMCANPLYQDMTLSSEEALAMQLLTHFILCNANWLQSNPPGSDPSALGGNIRLATQAIFMLGHYHTDGEAAL